MADQVALKTGAEEVFWDLTHFYKGADDPAIDADLEQAESRADALAAEYRGRVASLDAEEMRHLVEEYESIQELGYKVGNYAYLNWSTNTEDPQRGALLQKTNERGTRIGQKVLFVGLEWAAAPDEQVQSMIANPVLEKYRHWLELARLYRPYLLSEPEEKILAEKAITGRDAWVRFFQEVQEAARYDLDGEKVSWTMVQSKLREGDREVRQRAAKAMTEGLKETSRIRTYIFNNLLADKASDDRMRGYPTWISARNLSNEVDDASVEALVRAVTNRYDIVARYYHIKKRLLGLDELFDYDRYAPLLAAERFYSWDEAKQIVLNSYGKYHPKMREITSMFFDQGWIDAAVVPGKLGGAYSASTIPSVHPYILTNYKGKADDVMTLAHELGHGIHQFLSSRNGVLQQDAPLTTSETASVFGEMLVFQDLLRNEPDPEARLALLTTKIEDSFATIFRQISMNRFEDAIHNERRNAGELPTERFSDLWAETQRAMFGDSVTMTEDYGLWWSYIPHMVASPGYVYAYAFGNLLVLALYARYQEAPDGFADAYLNMLAAGGSNWPHEIVKPLGVDLQDPDFWKHGLQILDDMVTKAEEAAKLLGK